MPLIINFEISIPCIITYYFVTVFFLIVFESVYICNEDAKNIGKKLFAFVIVSFVFTIISK